MANTYTPRFFNRMFRNFLSGTLFIVPFLATGYFIFLALAWLDSLLNFTYPGLGLLIIVVVITVFGYFTKTYAFQTVENFFDYSVKRIPLVSLVYVSLKDLISAFVGEKKNFNKPVLARLNKDNEMYQIGFVTREDLRDLGLEDMVLVYFPHSYAISGFHRIVPRENIKPLNVSGPIAMKFIVSGGISGINED